MTVLNALYNAYATFIAAFVQSKLQGQSFDTQEDFIKAVRDAIREGTKTFGEQVGDANSVGDTYDSRTNSGKTGTAKDQTNAANALAEEIKKKAAEITPKPPRR